MTTKLVLFYSNYCVHCRQLLGDIAKHGLRSRFGLVCVDGRASLPSVVDRVPMALDPASRKVYVDDSVFHLVADMVGTSAQDVQAYHGQHTGYSDEFSFLGSDEPALFSTSYAAHDDAAPPPPTVSTKAIPTKAVAEGPSLDQLRSQRDQDMHRIHSGMPRPLA
jgi:hypothetical protein